MRVKSLAVAAVSILALTASACGSGTGSTTPDVTTLRVGSMSVSTFDYAKSNIAYYVDSAEIGTLILEPLLIQDSNGNLIPWLAESWEKIDPTTYVYHLRKGVKFSSGSELTAEDVVFSWDHYRAPGSADAYNFPDSLEKLTATDPYTVTAQLSRPDAAWQFVPASSQLGVFEKAFFESHKDTYGQPGTGVVGTGPWKLDSFNPTSGASLTANPEYWGEKPTIQKIDWTFYASETSSALAFRAGEVDLVMPSDGNAFAATANTKLITAPGVVNTGIFVMNVLQAPWNDVHVRRAVAYALNKNDLIAAGGVYAKPLDTFIPPAMLKAFGTEAEVTTALADVPTYPYDLDKAKKEMDQSAYAQGTDAVISTTGDGAVAKINQVVVAQLGKIGINVKMQVMTAEAQTAVTLGSDREAIDSTFTTFGGIGLDPGRSFDWAIGSKNATEGNWNSANWSNDTVDGLIDEGFATSDPAERLKIYAEMLKEFGENVPYVPIYLTDVSVALSSNFTWPGYSGYWDLSGPWALKLQAASA